ncbi:hypothetical protein D3C78_1516030 [compost metagenome]
MIGPLGLVAGAAREQIAIERLAFLINYDALLHDANVCGMRRLRENANSAIVIDSCK